MLHLIIQEEIQHLTVIWTELSVTLDTDSSSWSSWTDSGNIDLSSYAGGNVHIAFKYVSTSSASATYEIDNVLLTGE